MMKTLTMLLLLAVLGSLPAMAEPAAGPSAIFRVYQDTVYYVREGRLGVEDREWTLADNVVVLTRDGRPARLADLRRGTPVELTMLRGGVIQQIRMLK